MILDTKNKASVLADLEDALIECPHEFFVNDEQFFIYRPSFGATILVGRIIKQIGAEEIFAGGNALTNAMVLARTKRAGALELIYHFSVTGKMAHFDSKAIRERVTFFDENLDDKEIAQLLIVCLTLDNTTAYASATGMDKDEDGRDKAAKAKADRSTLFFGGKTAFGSIIDPVIAKYGWTYEYAVWEVSAVALRMLSHDAVTSVYMSKDELKKFRSLGGHSNHQPGSNKSMNFGQFVEALKSMKK